MAKILLAPILVVIAGFAFSPQSAAQPKPPYRVVPLPAYGYSVVAHPSNHLKIAPEVSEPLLWLAFVSSETSPLKQSAGYASQDVNILSVFDWSYAGSTKGEAIETDDSYLGGAGSVFPVRRTVQHLSVEFDRITLELDLVIKDGRMFITTAKYYAGCSGETGFAELKHLNKWLTQIEGGIEIPRDGFLEVDVPNPGEREPLAPGEIDRRNQGNCVSGHGKGLFGPSYFDLEVRPADPEARVYLGREYLGTAGRPFRISTNPADIVIRKDGYPDFAKRILFHEGPNYLDISFSPSPAKKVK
jgi:hypothetical protein